MADVFDAFRICITEGKCTNTDCPYDGKCEAVMHGGCEQYVQIPKLLALDVLNHFVEQEQKIAALEKILLKTRAEKTTLLDVFGESYRKIVLCKDCEHYIGTDENHGVCTLHGTKNGDWFCADGRKKDD